MRSLFLLVITTSIPLIAFAQLSDTSIAKTYVVSGEKPVSGDLISFDRETQTFHLTQRVGDKSVFGVVVTDPPVVLRASTEGTPLVTSGDAYVNVTTVQGPISAGDYLTSSTIPGKAQRADETQSFVIGTALDSFPGTSVATTSSAVYSGVVRVLLAIGPASRAAEAAGQSPTPLESGGLLSGGLATGILAPIALVVKYLLAAGVAIGTVYVAFRNFGSSLKGSIVSVGRNPLAKSSIQSMVVLNTILIILVSAAGLFLGLLILFFPL